MLAIGWTTGLVVGRFRQGEHMGIGCLGRSGRHLAGGFALARRRDRLVVVVAIALECGVSLVQQGLVHWCVEGRHDAVQLAFGLFQRGEPFGGLGIVGLDEVHQPLDTHVAGHGAVTGDVAHAFAAVP